MWVLRSAGTGDHRFELTEGQLARQVLHAAVGGDDEPLARHDGERVADSFCDDLARLGLARAEVEHAEDDRLVRHLAEHLEVETRLRRLEGEVRCPAVVELAEKRIAARLVLYDVRIPEAGVQDRLALDAG